jgi:hypothetical protein
LVEHPTITLTLGLPQLLFEQVGDAQALCGNQHLQPQRLRPLVEGAVTHLERARIRDAFADHMHAELWSSELFEISGTTARCVQIRSRLAARRWPDDAGVEKTSTGCFD